MAQVTQPAAIHLGGVWPPRLLIARLHCRLFFSEQVPHVISAAHTYHYKSMGLEPDETWLSHTGSPGR